MSIAKALDHPKLKTK